MWNIVEIATNLSFFILVAFIKISQLALVPLVLVVMFLGFFPFVGVHWYTIRDKMESWAIYAFKQKSFWYILWTPLGYHAFLLLLISCVWMFLCGMIVYLETCIHESVNLSPWYFCSLPTIFIFLFLGLVRTWVMSAWFTFIACSCTHISFFGSFWT